MYPQDARRESRPSKSRIRALEANLASLWELVGRNEAQPPPFSASLSEGVDDGSTDATPEASSQQRFEGGSKSSCRPNVWPSHGPQYPSTAESPRRIAHEDGDLTLDQEVTPVEPDESSLPDQVFPIAVPQRDEDTMSLHPCEGRVAGVSQIDGQILVHGPSSILSASSPVKRRHRQSAADVDRQASLAATRDRLICNAAVQRQRETQMYRQPTDTLDLDGIAPELAKHLLDLHWNRQHYAYLITYRPAIMDSLFNNGPWANKLLLNAIYYSSCLYSDRSSLRFNPDDPASAGRSFYNRFRELLVDAIFEPSIPTAAGLLLVSATLMSLGQSSPAWTLSGTAYRMITDMGCHLVQDPSQQAQPKNPRISNSSQLQTDVELEMRKRLFWGAFMTDSTQALYFGRPSSIALSESRVPQLLLDSYEELEDWTPYIESGSESTLLRSYDPRPAYAISTFRAMSSLFGISASINRELYTINSIKYGPQHLKAKRDEMLASLEHWSQSLPTHLKFDPANDPVPPPHQITPHTSFHAISIILQRPFMREGHLRRRTNNAEKALAEEVCIDHAMEIRRFVDAYRRTFTLRRAPFLLCYAVYSAVIVILNQEVRPKDTFADDISFFWTVLSELQRGCNYGLHKSLAVLRELMKEIGEAEPSMQPGESLSTRLDVNLGLPHGVGLDAGSSDLDRNTPRSHQATDFERFPPSTTLDSSPLCWDSYESTLFNNDSSFLGFLDDQEATISNDILYGLFAPAQSFP